VDIDGERRGGCVNEVVEIGRDSTINKGGRRWRRRCRRRPSPAEWTPEPEAVTSTGGIVRPASALVTAQLDQGGGSILAAVTQGDGVVASMGAGGEK